MASSSKQKNSSHKCCAAALCNNRSGNRPDIIFHNFPLDEKLKKIWDQKMKRGDKKCVSNSSLFCCSEHFSEKDYRKSLTGKIRDLVKNAVPSIFPWSVGNGEVSERSERAKSRECQRIQLSATPSKSMENKHHSFYDAPDISAKETRGEDSDEKPFEEERDLVAENYDLKQKLFLSKLQLAWRGLDRMMMTFFYTGFQSYQALIAFWNFIKPCSESLMSWNTAREKGRERSANNANPFPFLQGQEKQRNRKREIEPIDQLWLFLTRVRLGLFERDLAHRFSVCKYRV